MLEQGKILDWSLLALPGVEEVCEQAARSVATHPRYGVYAEYEDLKQEAAILAASWPAVVHDCLDPATESTLGRLKYRIQMDLINLVKTPTRRGERSESFEVRYDEDASDYLPRASLPIHRAGAVAYDRELVESLLPAVWDEDFCYGVQAENAPDVDMPRAAVNKATGNVLAAHLADIKVGWEKAPLTDKERVALLLMFAVDWPVKDIAYNQACSHQAITTRITNAVGKVVAQLNGTEAEVYSEEDAA